jgi:Tfp pilus assembly protein PilF
VAFAAFAVSCASSAPQPDTAAQFNAGMHRAAAELEAGQYPQAVQTLELLSRDAPKNEDVFVMLGDAHRGAGEIDAAIKSYEQAIRIAYEDHSAHLKLGTLLMEHGKTGRALTEFQVAVKFGPDDPLAHYNYGLAFYELGRKQEALVQWRIAQDIAPANADIVAAVGMGLAGVDDKAAVDCFERAEVLGAHGAAFCNNFGLALERVGRNQEAEKWLRVAATATDTRDEYRHNLAFHLMRVGKYQEAAQELDALRTAHGVRWSETVYLSRACVELERFDDAIQALVPFNDALTAGSLDRASDRVDQVPPSVAEALATLAMAWRGKGDLEKARGYARRSVELEPRNPANLNNYGVVLAESGMLADARAQWRRALEIDPENATARANLSAYER